MKAHALATEPFSLCTRTLSVQSVNHDREAIWDQAAGALLVEEAGGRVSDLDGLPLDFTTGRRLLRNSGLVASNGLLHEPVLGVMRQRVVR